MTKTAPVYTVTTLPKKSRTTKKIFSAGAIVIPIVAVGLLIDDVVRKFDGRDDVKTTETDD